MKKRIEYCGGARQQDRMIKDKLASLKKALLYSYQGATAAFDDKEFRCLINPSKVNLDEDVKILSMPYEDICLTDENENQAKTSEGQQLTNIAPGKVIKWKETNTYWLVYNQHLEELAYFRGELRRCDYEVDINGTKYWIYFKRGDEKLIDWRQTSKDYFNTLNYTAIMYITNNEYTSDYFKRFAVIKINGEPWEVQSVDRFTTKGLLTITLKEWYKNSIAEAAAAEKEPEPEQEATMGPRITGESKIYPFQQYSYTIEGISGGVWSVDNSKVKIVSQTDSIVTIYVQTGRSGKSTLTYTKDNEIFSLELAIESL